MVGRAEGEGWWRGFELSISYNFFNLISRVAIGPFGAVCQK